METTIMLLIPLSCCRNKTMDLSILCFTYTFGLTLGPESGCLTRHFCFVMVLLNRTFRLNARQRHLSAVKEVWQWNGKWIVLIEHLTSLPTTQSALQSMSHSPHSHTDGSGCHARRQLLFRKDLMLNIHPLSILEFNILPKHTLTRRLGIQPPTFWLVDDQLYLLSYSCLVAKMMPSEMCKEFRTTAEQLIAIFKWQEAQTFLKVICWSKYHFKIKYCRAAEMSRPKHHILET